MKETTRAHIVIPQELLDAVDRLVGKRKRSEFVVEALREKVSRAEQSTALKESAGILNPANHPEWDSAEKVAAWVHNLRTEDDEIRERGLQRRQPA